MNNFTKEIFNALSSNQPTAIKDVFRHQLETTVNQLLQNELTAVLGYESHERISRAEGTINNYRNGSYQRIIDTEWGPIKLKIPRDRLNQFQNALLPKYNRRTDSLESMIIKMYSHGVTTREIANLIEQMYGSSYSPTTVSNITKQTAQLVHDFHHQEFKHSQYVCVFLDATYIPLKRNTVEREAVNVAIGIRSDGGKEVLDYSIAPSENSETWSDLLQGLHRRGIKQVQLFVADGMVALQSAIERSYPQAKFQRCWTHLVRNVMVYVRKSERRSVIQDLTSVHQQPNLSSAQKALQKFITKWSTKYHRRLIPLLSDNTLFTYYQFPPAIRKTIYTTNLIESFNKRLKKMIRKKEQFPNEEALDRFLVTQVMSYNDKFENRTHRGFQSCQDTLDSMFN